MDDFLSVVLNRIEQSGDSFAQRAYEIVGSEVMPVLKVACVLYMMFYGVQLIMGTARVSVETIISRIVRMMVILALVSQWSNFNSLFYSWLTAVPENVGRAMLSVTGTGITEPTNGLAQIWKTANVAASSFSAQSGYFSVLPALYGFGILLATGLFIAVALYTLILAKVMLWLLVGVGPVFVGCMLFEETRSYGKGWIQQMIVYAIIPLFVYGVAAFLIAAINPELTKINAAAEAQTLKLSDVAAFLLLAIAGAFVLLNIQSLVQGVTGGVAGGAGFGRQALTPGRIAASFLTGGAGMIASKLGGGSGGSNGPAGGSISASNQSAKSALQAHVQMNGQPR